MMLDGGKWQGKQVVPERWVNEALTVHRKANESQDYGYPFWRRDYTTRCGKFSGSAAASPRKPAGRGHQRGAQYEAACP